MKAIDEIQDIGENLVSKVAGDKVLYEILPGLYQSGEIKEPKIIKDNGIQVVVDLEGST